MEGKTSAPRKFQRAAYIYSASAPPHSKPRKFPRAAHIFSSSASALNSPHPMGNRAPSHPVNPVHPVQKIPSLPPSAPPRLRGNSPFGCGSAALCLRGTKPLKNSETKPVAEFENALLRPLDEPVFQLALFHRASNAR